MKIMLVDDSRTMRNFQRRMLKQLGYNSFEEAGNGLDALKIATTFQPDLILLDWNMPYMSGVDFLKEFRKTDTTTPVVMVTTETEKWQLFQAIKAGANEFVNKPFTIDQLKEAIDKALDWAQRHEEDTTVPTAGSSSQAKPFPAPPTVKPSPTPEPTPIGGDQTKTKDLAEWARCMKKGLVLLVEDSHDDEVLTLRALNKAPQVQHVEVARDGVQALDYLFGSGDWVHRDTDVMPALILLDLKLPKLTGLEVLQHIRSSPATRLIPTVILTSSSEESDMIRSSGMGANSYIRKPVDAKIFGEMIQMLSSYWMGWHISV